MPLMQMVTSLIMVVAVILGLAWMSRRVQGLRGSASNAMRVRSSLAVGVKERIVVVDVEGKSYLIGVAPGRVSLLESLGESSVTHEAGDKEPEFSSPVGARTAPSLGESFARQLQQALGR